MPLAFGQGARSPPLYRCVAAGRREGYEDDDIWNNASQATACPRRYYSKASSLAGACTAAGGEPGAPVPARQGDHN